MLLQEIRHYQNPETNEHIDLAVLDIPMIKTELLSPGTPHLVVAVYTRYKGTGEVIDFPELVDLNEVATKLNYTFGQEPAWKRVDDVAPTGPLPDPLATPGHTDMMVPPETLADVEIPNLGEAGPPVPKASRSLLDEAEQNLTEE